MERRDLSLLKRLAERYHTLPLDKEELNKVCSKCGFSSSEVYRVLRKAVEEGYFQHIIFEGRILVYLDRVKHK